MCAGQSSERAALIYQHANLDRQEIAAALDARVRAHCEAAQAPSGTGVVERPRQQARPGSLTWAFIMERVTGIEPAL